MDIKEMNVILELKIKLQKKGWKTFVFQSEYYGSHRDMGDGPEKKVFMFHPSVDLQRWEKSSFSHGHFSENEDRQAWDAWLEKLDDKLYIEL